MVIGFKPQFKSPIMFGEKIHTIRADKNNRYKTGKMLHMALGVRTKNYECFKITTISSVQNIKIFHYNAETIPPNIIDRPVKSVAVYVDGQQLLPYQIVELAKNDGFNSTKEFFEWFNTDFIGKLIHWTDLQY